MDWVLKRQIYPRHAYRFDNFEARSKLQYAPAQERGMSGSTLFAQHL